MMSSLRVWTPLVKSLVNGGGGSSANVCRGWMSNLGAEDRPAFPPNIAVEVKAIACQLPRKRELPLSRLSLSEIRREVIKQGVVASISKTTLWRWLSQDAIQPWRFRTWLFPRDPHFADKAGRVLDLYARVWDGAALTAHDFVISADEKTR